MKKALMIMAMVGVIGMAGSAMAASDADVALWLKADAITGLSGGDPVTAWPDSSTTHTNDGATVAGAPTWETGVINGKPVVRYHSSSDRIQVPDDNSLDLTDYTIFTVQEYDTLTGDFILMSKPGDTTGWNYLVYPQAVQAGLEHQFGGTGGAMWCRGDSFGAVWSINGHYHDDGGNVARSYENGVEPGYGISDYYYNPATASPVANSNPLSIGGASGEWGSIVGDIAEIIIFDVALDTSAGGDFEDVNAYLADKYGIQVAGTGNPLEGRLLLGPLDGGPVIPEPAGLGLIALSLLAVRKRRR